MFMEESKLRSGRARIPTQHVACHGRFLMLPLGACANYLRFSPSSVPLFRQAHLEVLACVLQERDLIT